MSDLPEPLVPAEVDLKDFASMPLEFRRLFTSDTWILGTVEERCAALCLWCESWHSSPAASLPDNDRVLAHLSQAGHLWPKLKAQVMRGWIKCSDGKLYHPVVAEKALEAWAKHMKLSSRGKAGASKRWGTSIAQARKSNSTSNAQALTGDSVSKQSGCSSNGPSKKNDGIEVNRSELKAFDLTLGTESADEPRRQSQNLCENSTSKPSRKAVDLARSLAAKASGKGQ